MCNASLPPGVPAPDNIEVAADRIWARAEAVDATAAFPTADVADLSTGGWLNAALAVEGDEARPWLTTIGGASLTVGRLFEGHVNAGRLSALFGGGGDILRAEAAAGRISGVWNAERDGGVRGTRIARGWRLVGRKVHCSGAGSIRRPVVTAQTDEGWLMLLPDLTDPGVRIDLSVWRASGMRGTATGTTVFDGVEVDDAAVVGTPGDYYRSPWFSGGAWRVLAVQLGGLDRIMALHAERLRDDAAARGRFAEAAGAHEAARLLVAEAARRAEGGGDAESIDAYVDLARGTFESLALTVVAMARRNLGLSSFITPDPVDRCARDLETYLRQPFLDASRDNAATWLATHGGRFA